MRKDCFLSAFSLPITEWRADAARRIMITILRMLIDIAYGIAAASPRRHQDAGRITMVRISPLRCRRLRRCRQLAHHAARPSSLCRVRRRDSPRARLRIAMPTYHVTPARCLTIIVASNDAAGNSRASNNTPVYFIAISPVRRRLCMVLVGGRVRGIPYAARKSRYHYE